MQWLLEGPAIEPLLQRVREEHGPDVRIVRAERVRVGGFIGFFAREQFEVTIEVDDDVRPPLGSPARSAAPATPRTVVGGVTPHSMIPRQLTGVRSDPSLDLANAVDGLDALLSAAEDAERAGTPSFSSVFSSVQEGRIIPAERVVDVGGASSGGPSAARAQAAAALERSARRTVVESATVLPETPLLPPLAPGALQGVPPGPSAGPSTGPSAPTAFAGVVATPEVVPTPVPADDAGSWDPDWDPTAATGDGDVAEASPFNPFEASAPDAAEPAARAAAADAATVVLPAIVDPAARDASDLEAAGLDSAGLDSAGLEAAGATDAVGTSGAEPAPEPAPEVVAEPEPAPSARDLPRSFAAIPVAPAPAPDLSARVPVAPVPVAPAFVAPAFVAPVPRQAPTTAAPAPAPVPAPVMPAPVVAAPALAAPALAAPALASLAPVALIQPLPPSPLIDPYSPTPTPAPAPRTRREARRLQEARGYTEGEHLASRLAALGVPGAWLDGLPAHRGEALKHLAACIAATPAQSRRRTTVATSPIVVVLADLDSALPVARLLAVGLGLDETEVVTMHRKLPGMLRDRCLPSRADLLAEVDRSRERARAMVVVLPAPVGAPAADSGALADTLAHVEADEVWAVVDATRRLEDTATWLGSLGSHGVDAVALTNLEATVAPAAALGLAAPVVLLGDQPATPKAWVALLAARLAEQDLA